MLYIPRGIIHQAKATKEFSTHLTVSTYQAQSWGDVLHTVCYTFFTTQSLLHNLYYKRYLPTRRKVGGTC
jgi:hypothetical protein